MNNLTKVQIQRYLINKARAIAVYVSEYAIYCRFPTIWNHHVGTDSLIPLNDSGGPEPHLLTPLAHLGVWAKVNRAPYDHILAAEAQRLFVDALPNKEQDYWDACRAYCDVLYGRFMTQTKKEICLDKTPAYALILPFISKVFPDARYIVLTRHPLATFSSFANSFFDGDYKTAQTYNPILNRYIPAMAEFIRQRQIPLIHVRYEDLVQEPVGWLEKIYQYIGIPFEQETINYGQRSPDQQEQKGLGDPIGVQQYSRPSTDSLHKWVDELAAEPDKLALMQKMIAQLDADDLATIGYPPSTLWQPLEASMEHPKKIKKQPLTVYRLQRKAIVMARARLQQEGMLRNMVKRVQLACDVLLRE